MVKWKLSSGSLRRSGSTASRNENSSVEVPRRAASAKHVRMKSISSVTKTELHNISENPDKPVPMFSSSEKGRWEDQWRDLYPPTILTAVSRARKSSTKSSGTIYVVGHSVEGRAVDARMDVLGTYTSVAAANDHALAYFAEQYEADSWGVDIDDCEPDLEDFEPDDVPYGKTGFGTANFTRGTKVVTPGKPGWDITRTTGCLSLKQEEEGTVGYVFVTRQTLADEPPRCLRAEGGPRLKGRKSVVIDHSYYF